MSEILYAAILPLVISTLVTFVASYRIQDEPSSAPTERWRPSFAAGAIAFASAYLICHFGMHGKPAGTQLEAWEWLLVLVPLAAAVGAVGTMAKLPSWRFLLSTLALVLLSGWLLVPTFQKPVWVWQIVMGSTMLVLIVIHYRAVASVPIGIVLMSWVLLGATALPVLIASANLKFGLFASSVSAAAGGAFLISTFRRSQVLLISKSAIPVVSLLFPGILLSGHFNSYGEVPLSAFACLLAAPLGLLLVVVAMNRIQRRSWISNSVGLLSVVTLCSVAIFLAWPALTAEPAY